MRQDLNKLMYEQDLIRSVYESKIEENNLYFENIKILNSLD